MLPSLWHGSHCNEKIVLRTVKLRVVSNNMCRCKTLSVWVLLCPLYSWKTIRQENISSVIQQRIEVVVCISHKGGPLQFPRDGWVDTAVTAQRGTGWQKPSGDATMRSFDDGRGGREEKGLLSPFGPGMRSTRRGRNPINPTRDPREPINFLITERRRQHARAVTGCVALTSVSTLCCCVMVTKGTSAWRIVRSVIA